MTKERLQDLAKSNSKLTEPKLVVGYQLEVMDFDFNGMLLANLQISQIQWWLMA